MERSTLLVVFAGIFTIGLFVGGLAFRTASFCGGYGMMGSLYTNPFGWVFGPFVTVMSWILIIVIIVYFVKMITDSKSTGNQNARRKR
jgi:uncharacterized membrane protein